MEQAKRLPVIDLFAGPGGLGEGFSVYRAGNAHFEFKIALSIEKDSIAHKTLELRSFFRQFSQGRVPEAYYDHLRGKIQRDELFRRFPEEADKARLEAWNATLGSEPVSSIDFRIRKALAGSEHWVLVGGPPCQAYSIVGRSRNRGIVGYQPEKDHRHYLYREYLRILAKHWPSVFVMENVPGILSAKVDGGPIFDRLLHDLRSPAKALGGRDRRRYHIYSLVTSSMFGSDGHEARDFIVKAEDYGIPQARHRVILLGIRADLGVQNPAVLKKHTQRIPVSAVLKGLPRLRSGLSKGLDGPDAWRAAIDSALNSDWLSELGRIERSVKAAISEAVENVRVPRNDRGNDTFLECDVSSGYAPDWYLDPRLNGLCNHGSRSHIVEDLHRYLFATCFAKVKDWSPVLADFPISLWPDHRNAVKSLDGGYFGDRFRVQLSGQPATTITSHISRDGHYYIHYDPTQCRSLTVREAARLQTFPDNYLFCGPRTSQYQQVGNAVPPLLARQIAQVVMDILAKAGIVKD